LVVKYEWYDPNTKLSSEDFVAGTSFKSAELRYDMLGLGYVYYWDDNVKFMVYYNIVQNEKGAAMTGYTKDLHDNVFTVRMQYRF
jgi:phosphate-selective porin